MRARAGSRHVLLHPAMVSLDLARLEHVMRHGHAMLAPGRPGTTARRSVDDVSFADAQRFGVSVRGDPPTKTCSRPCGSNQLTNWRRRMMSPMLSYCPMPGTKISVDRRDSGSLLRAHAAIPSGSPSQQQSGAGRAS